MIKIKNILPIFIIIFLLIVTRFAGLTWGFPFLFHPDERNIVISLEQLKCINFFDFKNCLNPNFFAYGQFLLYLGKFISVFVPGKLFFIGSTLILRILSAMFSIGTIFVSVYLILLLSKEYLKKFSKKTILITSSLVLIFSPGLIQIAHFGTTESILTFIFTSQILASILYHEKKINSLKFIILSSLLIGIAIASKVSSVIYLALPATTLLLKSNLNNLNKIKK